MKIILGGTPCRMLELFFRRKIGIFTFLI